MYFLFLPHLVTANPSSSAVLLTSVFSMFCDDLQTQNPLQWQSMGDHIQGALHWYLDLFMFIFSKDTVKVLFFVYLTV